MKIKNQLVRFEMQRIFYEPLNCFFGDICIEKFFQKKKAKKIDKKYHVFKFNLEAPVYLFNQSSSRENLYLPFFLAPLNLKKGTNKKNLVFLN